MARRWPMGGGGEVMRKGFLVDDALEEKGGGERGGIGR